MAYTESQWEKAKAYYEAGMSLSQIKDKTNISRSKICEKAKKMQWLKVGIDKSDITANKQAGTIYLIQAGESEYYKIGITKDSIEYRLKQLQTGNHLKLKVVRLYFSQDCFFEEKELHKQFSLKHSIGEWFKLSKEDIEFLKQRLTNG